MDVKSGCGEEERSLYLIQIQYLDDQLERCLLKCDELEKQNKALASQRSTLEKDKKDINEHLKHSVVAKEAMIDELTEQLEREQQDREDLKLQHSQQIREMQERLDELNSVRKMQVAKSEEQKKELMQQPLNVKSLKKELISQKKEHEAAINTLMMEEDLKIEEMMNRAVALQNEMDFQAEMSTSAILQQERAKHNKRFTQLQFLMYDTTALQKEIHDLQDRWNDIVIEWDDQNHRFNKSVLENSTLKEEMKQFKKMCKQLEAELRRCSNTHERLLAEEEHLRQALLTVSKECSQKTAKISQLGLELQKQKSGKKQLQDITQDAVIILRHILTQDSEKASDTQWKTERLLDILESNAPRGPASAFEGSTVKSSRGQKPQTDDPKPSRKVHCSQTSSSVGLLAVAPQQTDPEAGTSASTTC